MTLRNFAVGLSLVLASVAAVAQELPWYEVQTFGAGTTIDLYDSGYYKLSTGIPITSQLFDPNGNPMNLDFNVTNVDQFGVAYGSTKVTPGYQSLGASQDLKNVGPVRVYSNMNTLDGGNTDVVFGTKVPNSGFPWATTSADQNDLSKFGRVSEFMDMNSSGMALLSSLHSNSSQGTEVVYVPGQGFKRLARPTLGPNGEVPWNSGKYAAFQIADDGAVYGNSGIMEGANGLTSFRVVWDSVDAEARFIDINNLSQQDVDRFGPFIDANQIYGAGGIHSQLADRIVNPSGEAYYSNLVSTRDGSISGVVSYTNAEGIFIKEAFVAKPVPEPTTIAVIGLGVCGLLLRRRKRSV